VAKVYVTDEATTGAARLPRPIQLRVLRIIDRLQRWPAVSGAKPLRHGLAGRYRIRTGDYRVQFRVERDEVIVELIGHRDGFYEDQE
jgi:mRNA-degrading endonuclease RelE of RelBE toxin-antitoxin system